MGHFILLLLFKSSWKNFGISEYCDFQKCYVVSNFQFLETFSFTRVKQKLYLNVAKYYDHICASARNSVVRISRCWVGVKMLHICQILVHLKVHASNGKMMILSKCAICGSKKSKFIKKQEAKGLLCKLGIKTPFRHHQVAFYFKCV